MGLESRLQPVWMLSPAHAGTTIRLRPAGMFPESLRELELFQQHGDGWKQPLRPLTRWCHFRRGFVEHVSLRPRTFFTHSAELFARAPVQSVTLQGNFGTPVARALARFPGLARLRRLS